TFFQNVFSLPPAHSASYDIGTGRFQTWRYWDIDIPKFEARWKSEDPIATLRSLVESSVQFQMRSDVPVGSCLSGGIDSSTIVGFMSRLRRDPVRTFSGIYDDPDCCEKAYVDAVNSHCRALGNAVRPEPGGDLLSDLSKISWHQDEPSAGPGV